MIIGSCSGVTDPDIRQAIAWKRTSEPCALITPGKIDRALGKTTEYGGCIQLFVERLRSDARSAVPAALRGLRR
jgi:bacterioferritin-associated ferredoxin